jgi:Tol biopolymer transport system component
MSFDFAREADAGADVAPDTVDRCAADDVVLGTWSAPQPVVALNSGFIDEDPTPAFDDVEIFFISTRGGSADIYTATRPDPTAPWGPASPVTALNGPSTENTIALSDDALTIWFASNRGGGAGNDDIWNSTRSDRSSPWTAPVNVMALNTGEVERGPTLFDADRSLILHSLRPTGPGANDLYISTRDSTADAWHTPVLLGPPNSGFTEQHAWVSPCGKWMVFHTNRTGGIDLYETSRNGLAEPFGNLTALTELNTPSTDRDMRMLPDRRHAYLTSDRDGTFDIYEVTR